MKKLTAKIGEYQKDGATKGRYVNVGVLMNSNDGGEYVLLDPVSVAGILVQQNVLAASKGEQLRDRVMCGVWEENNQQQGQQQQQQAPQQQQQQQQHYAAPQSQNFQNSNGYQNGS